MTKPMMVYRNAIVADDNKKLVEFDLRQAEAMIVAWLANDDQLKHAFKTGEDVHSLTGAMLFALDYKWVKANKKTDAKAKLARQTAKPVNHGYNYAMGPKALSETMDKFGLNYTLSDCKDFLKRMHIIRPAVTSWQRGIQNSLRKDRNLITPLGFRRTFLGRLTDNVFRSAYAFIPQSTVGHMLVKIWNNIDAKHSKTVDCLLNVHDSLLIQYPECSPEQEHDLLLKIAKEFLIPLTINNDQLIIPVDCKIGYSFGDMDDYPLPELDD